MYVFKASLLSLIYWGFEFLPSRWRSGESREYPLLSQYGTPYQKHPVRQMGASRTYRLLLVSVKEYQLVL
jgi:hypothetical protein